MPAQLERRKDGVVVGTMDSVAHNMMLFPRDHAEKARWPLAVGTVFRSERISRSVRMQHVGEDLVICELL